MFEQINFADWTLWERIGIVAGAILSILGIAKIVRELFFPAAPKDEAAARVVLKHMLENGPPRRPFVTYRKRLRNQSVENVRALLIQAGAVETKNRYTGREMWGLKRRNP